MKHSALIWPKRWLALALGALALSAALALLLILTRTPFIQDYLGIKSWFHFVLVLHVNFAVLVWLMSFIAFLWLREGLALPTIYQKMVWSLGLVSIGCMLISPLLLNTLGDLPIMSNYIPVINSPLFLIGLGGFSLAISLIALAAIWGKSFRSLTVLDWAAWFWLSAVSILVIHGLDLTDLQGWLLFESLFWGAGHVLQFVYVLVIWAVWRWPDTSSSRMLNILFLFILLIGLALAIAFDPHSNLSKSMFSYLMQWGMPFLLLPLIIYWGLKQGVKIHSSFDLAITSSVALMAIGFILGVAIQDDSVMVTAHYHATNAAITVAFMGLIYKLWPNLGLGKVPEKAAGKQILFYSVSMFFYVLGMAASGLLGVPRKTALLIDQGWEQIAMTIMGLGGFLSIISSLIFIYLLIKYSGSNRSVTYEKDA